MTLTLDADFEDQLRAAALADATTSLTDGGLLEEMIEHSEEHLRKWADEYNVEPILESLDEPEVELDPTTGTITVRWGWDHPAAGFFEFGTSDHTIEGDPILSFVWHDPPQWVREEFDQARDAGGRYQTGYRVFLPEVDVAGIDETRFGREGLRWLRAQMRSPTEVA